MLEDLHWGDVSTVRFLEAALRTCAELPLLVVAFARPEAMGVFPNLFAERGAQTVRLGDLTRRASENLVRHVLGARAEKDVVDRLVDRAAGNALYLEEILRAWSEGRGERLPDTVLAMMQARLEGFGADERRVLRAASIFGLLGSRRRRSSRRSELAAKGGLDEGEALVRLARAEALWASVDREGASVAITAARDRLLEAAAKVSDPAWRKSFLENVEENARTLARAEEWLTG